MLTLFRTNQFVLNILLIFYVAILRVSSFIVPQTIEPMEGGVISQWIQSLFTGNDWASDLFACILVFVQAFMVNIIFSKNRLTSPTTLIPGVIYILLVSSIPEFLYLSPLLIANTFYIIAVMQLFDVHKKHDNAGKLFNIGFWIGIGSLCYFSFFMILFVMIFGVSSLSAFRIKDMLIIFVGFFVPFFLTGVGYFLGDELSYFSAQQLQFPQKFLNWKFPFDWESYIKIGFFTVLILTSILSYGTFMSKKEIRIQKKISVLYWGIFFGLLSILFHPDIRPEHLLMVSFPLAVLLALRFVYLKSNIAETLHFLLLAGILILQFKYFWMV